MDDAVGDNVRATDYEVDYYSSPLKSSTKLMTETLSPLSLTGEGFAQLDYGDATKNSSR